MIKTNDYLREFITISFMQRHIILGVALIIWVVTILIAFLWPPTYAAVSTVVVKHKEVLKSPETLEKNVKLSVPRVDERDIFSEMEIVTSSDLIKETIETLQRKNEVFPENLTPAAMRQKVALIKKNLKTELKPKSDVFQVILDWHDPVEAEIILQTLMDRYQIYRARIYNPEAEEKFFKKQLGVFDKKLTEKEHTLLELAKASESPDPSKRISNNLMIEKNLKQELNTLLSIYVKKKSYLQFIEKELASKGISTFSYIGNINIGDYGKRLTSMMIKRQELLTVYSPRSEKIKLMNEQIWNTYKGLKSEVKRYVDGEKAKLNGMREAIESLRKRLKKVTDSNINTYENFLKAKKIKRQIRLLEESYNTFSRRWEESKINQNTNADKIFSISIMDKARAIMTPVFPDKKTLIPIGILVGLLLGFTIGFLREFFDHSFKRPEDVNNYLGVTTVLSIPEY